MRWPGQVDVAALYRAIAGCGDVATGCPQGSEDFPLPHNPNLSIRDVLSGKNAVLMFT
jgi:hypothetical protein